MITEEFFRKTINRCYAQEGLCKVPRKALNYSNELSGGWEAINTILKKWEKTGLVKILCYPEHAQDNQICIEILKFLDGREIPSNWIRDRF